MADPDALRIALIGQKGVPATFGGIEHHVEEIGARLAARGHQVTVYLRPHYAPGAPDQYRGMALQRVPTVRTKHLDCIVHTALCTGLAMRDIPDVIHYHALGPSLLAPLPRLLSRSKVVATLHGLDYEREKWGVTARTVLRTAGWLTAHVPDATIAVSRALADHYAARYHRHIDHIPNGVTAPAIRPARAIVDRFGVRPRGYVLFVGRLVPEKAVDLLIRAFREVRTDVRLLIAGGSSHTDEFVRTLESLAKADPRVVFTGYVYGELLEELYSNAAAFVLPSTVEGLPLTLLEAASYGIPVVASSIPPHLEVLGRDGPGHRLFPARDGAALAGAISRVLEGIAIERAGAAKLRERVLAEYSWDRASVATEDVYTRLVERSRRAPVWAPGMPVSGAPAVLRVVGRPVDGATVAAPPDIDAPTEVAM